MRSQEMEGYDFRLIDKRYLKILVQPRAVFKGVVIQPVF